MIRSVILIFGLAILSIYYGCSPVGVLASGGATIEIMKFIRGEQKRFAEKWPDIDLYVSGGVPLTLAFTEVSMKDISTLLPIT